MLASPSAGRSRPAVDWALAPMRGVLFAPGSDRRKLEKVEGFGADAIVLDLEDAVEEDRKDAARELVHEYLATYSRPRLVWVRVNGWRTGRLAEDVAAAISPDLDGIFVPKVEDPDTLHEVDELLLAGERRGDLLRGQIRILPIVETALGIARLTDIALAAPARVVTLAFGAVDFALDVGVDQGVDLSILRHARAAVVVAARAAGLAPPIDGPYLQIGDEVGLQSDSCNSRAEGFQGRVAIHPNQVEVVQRAYTELTPEEEEKARTVVTAFEEAQSRGVASIQINGLFVDYPVYYREKRKLNLQQTLAGDGLRT
jgi:citrate lyase subunit beta / citryl-CoA lyase